MVPSLLHLQTICGQQQLKAYQQGLRANSQPIGQSRSQEYLQQVFQRPIAGSKTDCGHVRKVSGVSQAMDTLHIANLVFESQSIPGYVLP